MSAARGRLVFAVVAATGLAVALAVVVISGSSEEGPADECIDLWNGDAIARSDGVHAYSGHGYRATVVSRVDPAGAVVPGAEVDGPPSPDQRCAVIFAAAQVAFEFDFGVRVLDSGRWAGLAAVDGVPPEKIVAIQGEATGEESVALLPDGRLAN